MKAVKFSNQKHSLSYLCESRLVELLYLHITSATMTTTHQKPDKNTSYYCNIQASRFYLMNSRSALPSSTVEDEHLLRPFMVNLLIPALLIGRSIIKFQFARLQTVMY